MATMTKLRAYRGAALFSYGFRPCAPRARREERR
jgi:hypothetical protein